LPKTLQEFAQKKTAGTSPTDEKLSEVETRSGSRTRKLVRVPKQLC